MVNNIAFIYLTAFSKAGGIEQFNKNLMTSIHQIKPNSVAISLYDTTVDEKYFPQKSFKGFAGNKIAFLFSLIFSARKHQVYLIGHINLSLAAFIIKFINPKAQFLLMAHGVEIWPKQKRFAHWLIKSATQIFSVSQFTKSTILINNPSISSNKIKILHNSVDPYFNYPISFTKPNYLIDKYHLNTNDKLILTTTRLSSDEQYKGYDAVISIIKRLNNEFGPVKYLIVGKADDKELDRVNKLIKKEQIDDNVILSGFVPLHELIDHYLLADVFVLPSTGEGFGIVLIEAMACGLKVIAGNKDGSVDALLNGELGTLINPSDTIQLYNSINNLLQNNKSQPLDIQHRMKEHFSYPIFKKNIQLLLTDL